MCIVCIVALACGVEPDALEEEEEDGELGLTWCFQGSLRSLCLSAAVEGATKGFDALLGDVALHAVGALGVGGTDGFEGAGSGVACDAVAPHLEGVWDGRWSSWEGGDSESGGAYAFGGVLAKERGGCLGYVALGAVDECGVWGDGSVGFVFGDVAALFVAGEAVFGVALGFGDGVGDDGGCAVVGAAAVVGADATGFADADADLEGGHRGVFEGGEVVLGVLGGTGGGFGVWLGVHGESDQPSDHPDAQEHDDGDGDDKTVTNGDFIWLLVWFGHGEVPFMTRVAVLGGR